MYKLNKGYINQKTKKNLTIFDPSNSSIYSLNRVAADIIDKIHKKWNKKHIADFIIKKYKVERNIANRDINQFIMTLKKKKIISFENTKK